MFGHFYSVIVTGFSILITVKVILWDMLCLIGVTEDWELGGRDLLYILRADCTEEGCLLVLGYLVVQFIVQVLKI